MQLDSYAVAKASIDGIVRSTYATKQYPIRIIAKGTCRLSSYCAKAQDKWKQTAIVQRRRANGNRQIFVLRPHTSKGT